MYLNKTCNSFSYIISRSFTEWR